MKRNYMLVYSNRCGGKHIYEFFETKEDMKNFIKDNLSRTGYWKVLYKYELKEVK